MATPSAAVADMSIAMISPNALSTNTLPPPMALSPNGNYDASGPLPSQQVHTLSQGVAGMLPSASRSVKRPRPVKSCTECRKRKLKCDRNLPCAQCQKSHRNCKYAADHDSSALSDASDVETGDVPRPPKRNCLPSQNMGGGGGGAMHLGPPYPGMRNGDANGGGSSLEALASRVDRLEHYVLAKSPYGGGDLSGVLRLQLHPEMIRGLTVKAGASRTRFFGQSSVRVLLNLFEDAKEFLAVNAQADDFRDLMSTLSRLHKSILDDYKRLLTPMPVYVTSATPVQNRMKHILTKLPGREVCDRLLRSYIRTTEAIYRIVHIPTMMAQYELYWEGNMHSDAFLCQLLLIMAVGSRFETESKGLDPNVVDGVHIPTACELVRSWLYSLKGKQLVDFATLQTEVLLLHTQRMIGANPQELWRHVGTLVRTAMTMGLHRDPSEFENQIPVFAGELRRRLWFTILEIDLHVSLVCNLRCSVEEEDFTCRLPRNLDDAELTPNMTELPPSQPIDQPTDNQIQSYAARTLGTRLKIIHLVSRIDSIRDYGGVLELGAKMERFSEDVDLLFPRDSSLGEAERTNQWRCRVILDMHVRRPLLALYRPFALGSSNPPPQITQAYLRSSLVILGYLDEVDPRLVHYHSVSDMYHQVLKKDMLQASLSLCYYIRSGIRAAGSPNQVSGGGGGGSNAMAMSPRSFDDSGPASYESDGPALYSPSRLIKTVEKTMALLMRNVGGSDVKDIIVLMVVFASVQGNTTEQRLQEIKRGLSAVVEACMRASKLSPDKVMLPRPGEAMDPYRQPPHYMMHGGAPQQAATGDGRDDIWRLWRGWDLADDSWSDAR
jgi:hypothetical protein